MTNTGLIIGLSVALALMVIVMGIMIYFCVKKLSLGYGSGNQYIQVNWFINNIGYYLYKVINWLKD